MVVRTRWWLGTLLVVALGCTGELSSTGGTPSGRDTGPTERVDAGDVLRARVLGDVVDVGPHGDADEAGQDAPPLTHADDPSHPVRPRLCGGVVVMGVDGDVGELVHLVRDVGGDVHGLGLPAPVVHDLVDHRVLAAVAHPAALVGGETVELTAYEYRVLEHLMLHAGEVVSKTALTEHIYEENAERDSNVIEVFVRRLRAKLDPEGVRKPIETLRGRGYRLARDARTPTSDSAQPS